ncbi:MAG: fibronectin-binding domain-containing protein [Candidatus Lokiarchaeota archaeon]|nr:fibronectin-binding domain-containing protein [Candidatus Lokiarchaeota archaeon]
MIKLGREFSNFDVFAIVKELDLILLNGTILNIYEIEDLLIIKINTNSGKKNLIVKKDTRINLTEYDYPIPNYPSQYISSLRKFLKNRRILKISQHKFDRIIVIELSSKDNQPWKFVIELFNKGNFLLLDEENIIKIAKKYRKFRDRELLAKRVYNFPKSQGTNFLTINKEEFKELFKNSDAQIVRDISRKIHISGLYSEEICYRVNINKLTIGKNLTEEEYEDLYDSFKSLRNQLLFSQIDAQIVFDQQGKQISVLPFEIHILKDYDKKKFTSFNAAVDEFFSKVDSELLKNPKEQKVDEQISSHKKILKNQQEYLIELKDKKEKYYNIGEIIFANLNSLEKLRSVLIDAKKKGYSWEEINTKLKIAKLEHLNGSEFFEKVIPSTNQLLIKINNNDVYIDLKKSLGENANNIYSKGKKAEKKIEGTITAIVKTRKKIDKLKFEKESLEVEIDFLIKKPKKKWYERFRWFVSSDGYLIIGGRDATSNEIIFKKYIEPNDLVFHTNFPGSPLVVVKNIENKKIPLNTIKETGDFVASFSRAWKETWGIVDIFYIHPDQISRNPPSGEFLPKGSFIISGKKNFIKNAKTELAIGLNFIELKEDSKSTRKIFFPKIISGPETAIKKQTKNIITILPSKSGGFTKGKLAKEIKSYFIRNIDKELKIWVKLLSIDDILLYLPSGISKFKSQN